MRKSTAACISILAGAALFAAIYPYQHDMYIAAVHTALCVALNAASSLLLAVILYCLLRGTFWAGEKGIFLWFLVLLGAGHAVFAMMNWGSWLILTLTAALLLAMLVNWIKTKKQG